METSKRSIAKAITWRALASLVTLVTILAFGMQIHLAMGIAMVDLALKLFFYYAHERLWLMSDFGKDE